MDSMRISVRPRRDGIKGWTAKLLFPRPPRNGTCAGHPGWLLTHVIDGENRVPTYVDMLLESPGATLQRHAVEGPFITTWSPNGDGFKVDGYELVVARDGVPV